MGVGVSDAVGPGSSPHRTPARRAAPEPPAPRAPAATSVSSGRDARPAGPGPPEGRPAWRRRGCRVQPLRGRGRTGRRQRCGRHSPTDSRAASASATDAAPAGRSAGSLASSPWTRSAASRGSPAATLGRRAPGPARASASWPVSAPGTGAAGEQGVEHAPQRVEVGATVHPSAHGLLGSEVLRGSHHGVRRECLGAGRLAQLGDAESSTRTVTGIRDVGRLDVPVHQSAGMCGIERGRHLLPDLDDLLDGHGPVGDPVGEARGRRRLHDDVCRVALDAAVVHRDDAGMAEAAVALASRSNAPCRSRRGPCAGRWSSRRPRGRARCRCPARPRPCRPARWAPRGRSGRPVVAAHCSSPQPYWHSRSVSDVLETVTATRFVLPLREGGSLRASWRPTTSGPMS